jgi:hypothetical protein
VLLLERPVLFTGLLQASFCKRDLQDRYFRFLSTYQVYMLVSDTKALDQLGI